MQYKDLSESLSMTNIDLVPLDKRILFEKLVRTFNEFDKNVLRSKEGRYYYDRLLDNSSKQEEPKKEYFDGKFAWFFKLAGCIPVDRSIHDDKAKAAALEVLELDGAVGLFPEGTRNKTDDLLLLPFKFGTVSMAQKTGATIVPCALTGDYTFRSKNLMFRVGKPFKVDKKDDLAEANDKL